MEIRINAKIDHEIKVDVHIDELIEAINEMPIAKRFNYVGMLFNEINTEDLNGLEVQKRSFIRNYFQKQIVKLSDENQLLVNVKLLMQLESKRDWINKIPDQLPEKKYFGEKFLFIDSKGSFLELGEDFEAAEILDTYPVCIYRKITSRNQL